MKLPRSFAEDPIRWGRYFLTDTLRDLVDFRNTDQSRGVPAPPIQKPVPADTPRISLTPPAELPEAGLGRMPLLESIARRESIRQFADSPISLPELSFLLWATQGVRRTVQSRVFRTVPSAGNRHALETYLYCRKVESLDEGIYRYLPLDHTLVLERAEVGLAEQVILGCRGQRFAGLCAVSFIWTAIPYRMEWRYGLAAHKVIALDAGHACQNLYLACQTIEAGTCAIAAYDQEAMDSLLGVDGDNEFTLYVSPVGKRI